MGITKPAGIVNSLRDLAYPDPLELEEEKKERLIKAMPLSTRRRLSEAFRVIRFALERQVKQKSDQSGG